MTETPFRPLTAQLLDTMRAKGVDVNHLAALEGADLMRELIASGKPAEYVLAQGMAKLCSSSAPMAEMVIASLLTVAVQADRIIAKGAKNFTDAPADVQDKIREAAGG